MSEGEGQTKKGKEQTVGRTHEGYGEGESGQIFKRHCEAKENEKTPGFDDSQATEEVNAIRVSPHY
jgi:hypothetical protein